MNCKSTISFYQAMRQMMALMLSVLLIPAAHLDLYAQPPPTGYIPLTADQLDQLVAPIALDPDALVAQILTSATYPDQVAAANIWSNQNAGLPAEQRAAAVNGMPWDPAVKGLTAFPSVLDNLARNTSWTAQLGNAYYNQPEDVMNAVQAMRFQAQQSNVLVTTVQQRVYVDNGAILIVPVNPGLVYVPYYNPWRIWGTMFVAYPGFYLPPPPVGLVVGVGIGFAVGISVGLFAGYGWGFGAWGANWRGGGVLYNHGAYVSRSMSVANHGHFGGHNSGAFEHGGRGVPGGYHAAAHSAGVGRAPAGRSGFGGHSGAPAGRPGPAGRAGAPAARAGAPAGRSGAPAGRSGAPAARAGAPTGRSGAPAGRAGAPSGRAGAPAGRSGAPAGRAGAPAGRAGAPAGRAGAPAGHSASAPAKKGR
jgi:hypothetical protein